MKNFLFNKLFCSVVLSIFFISCSKHTYKNATVTEGFSDTLQSNFFKTDSIYYFKTSVTTYGKELSGILAIKQQHSDTLKVSFFTEMGVSFFDVVVAHDSYQLIRCISQLDSKVIMNTLVEDIRWVVLFNTGQLHNGSVVQSKSMNKMVRFDYQNEYMFAELGEENIPLKLDYVYGSKFKSKFEIRFTAFEKQVPEKIIVEHNNFNMKIDLTAISFEK